MKAVVPAVKREVRRNMQRRTAAGVVCANLVFIMLTVTFAVLHKIFDQGWMLAVYITFLTISYHFAMRLAVGELVTATYRNRELTSEQRGSATWTAREEHCQSRSRMILLK